MDARRAQGREAAVYSAGPHWIALEPGAFFLGIAAAVQHWGTSDLVERFELDAIPEQVMSITGSDLDSAITTLALLLGVVALGRGLARVLFTRLRVTPSSVRWEQRGLRSHDLAAGFGSVEGLEVEQGFLGRLLGYGTVNVRGRNAIGRRRRISRPTAFRKACNDQMSTWLCRPLASDPRRKKASRAPGADRRSRQSTRSRNAVTSATTSSRIVSLSSSWRASG